MEGAPVAKWALRLLLAAILLCSVLIIDLRASQLHRDFIRYEVGNAVVTIVRFDEFTGRRGGGTGFQVWSKELQRKVILTNRHVCKMYEGGSVASIILNDGTMINRPILEISQITDLCAIDGIESLPTISLAKSVSIGEEISIVGHPALMPTTVTEGEIFQETILPVGEELFDAFMSTAHILPGNSGSPAVDWKGDLIGVVFEEDQEIHWSCIIPLRDVKYFLNNLGV